MWTQRGHKGCTSTGTDAHVDDTVKVRVRHVIDRSVTASRNGGLK